MIRPPVNADLFLGLYSLFYSCTIALDAIVASVLITEQRVPGAVLNGTEHVVLDCVYKLKPNEVDGLVITWYFNNSPSPAYQWIPGKEPPRVVGGPLRNRIRLGYEVPTDDPLAKYRALYIVRPTIELTGNYRCVVSTYLHEDFMIKKMIVYAPGHNMHMKRTKTDQDTVNISCTVYKVYPRPMMRLYKLDTNGTETRPFKHSYTLSFKAYFGNRVNILDSEWSEEAIGYTMINSSLPVDTLDYQNDDAYDVTVSTFFSESELPSRTVFFCEIVISGTPYTLTKRFVYNPGDSESLFADNFATWSSKSSKMLQWTTVILLSLLIEIPN